MDRTLAFLEEKLHSSDWQVLEQTIEKRKKDELAILSSTSRIQKAKQAVQLEQENKPVDLSKLRKLTIRFEFLIFKQGLIFSSNSEHSYKCSNDVLLKMTFSGQTLRFVLNSMQKKCFFWEWQLMTMEVIGSVLWSYVSRIKNQKQLQRSTNRTRLQISLNWQDIWQNTKKQHRNENWRKSEN